MRGRLGEWGRVRSTLNPHDASGRALWLRTFQAGTTTAVVLIPQAMAYAMVAGLPPIHGLYASLLPLVLYALVGRSRELAVGPGALDTLLVGAALGGLAVVTADNYAYHAALLALMVGAVQAILALLRAGFLINFLSRPVISGFTSAAALVIALSQARHLLGYDAEGSMRGLALLHQLWDQAPHAHKLTAAVGLGSVVLLVIAKRSAPRAPYALAVVALMALAGHALSLETRGVALVGAVPSGLPSLTIPPFEWATLVLLAPTALTIALIGYLTMISIAQTFANRGAYEVCPNRELAAAGIANIGAGLTQGFPVSASFSRSAVHASAGSPSPHALAVTAGWVGVTLVALTELIEPLPRATLAAIIVTAVLSLVDLSAAQRLWRVKRADFWLLFFTFCVTFTVGIEEGILGGVLASLALFLFRTTRPHAACLGRIPGTTDFRNVKHYPKAETFPGVLIVRIDAQFYFGNVSFLRAWLRDQERRMEVPLRAVVLEACSLNQLDSSANDALEEIVAAYRRRGVRFVTASVKRPVAAVMQASGLWDAIGAGNHHLNVQDAVDAVTGAASLNPSER